MEEKAQGGSVIERPLPRLVFMGTPEFALPSLRLLHEAGANIPAVVTQPDRGRGRGRKPSPSPVKALAEQLGLPVFQPERIRDPEAMEHLRSLAPECLVVVAYGQFLPKSMLDAFPLGGINVHPSLLPKYRGAAPIQRSILAGDTETGVCIMLMDQRMDAGPILAMATHPINESDTSGTLHDKLAETGGRLLRDTLARWKAGMIEPAVQDDALACHAAPIGKEELLLDWNDPADRIVNRVRAMDPWPGAYTFLGDKRLKCFNAALAPLKGDGAPGEVVGRTEDALLALAGDGRAISLGDLQIEGQRRVPAAEFLKGRPIDPGTVLGRNE